MPPSAQKLVQAILSRGPDQQKLLNELADSGSKIVHDVLTAWTRDGVYLYTARTAPRFPSLLEDQLDADGKARAIRIIDGQFVKDANGEELRFAASDLNNAETDMRLAQLHPADHGHAGPGRPESRGAPLGGAQAGQFAKAAIHPHPPGPLAKEPDADVRQSHRRGHRLAAIGRSRSQGAN